MSGRRGRRPAAAALDTLVLDLGSLTSVREAAARVAEAETIDLLINNAGAAWPSLYAATSPEVRSGDFIEPAARRQDSGTPQAARLPRGADDPGEGARLWAASEQLTGVTFAV
ncbi:MAG: hypothetical protein ABW000_17310 [Actinoplanes sp.]